jgi:hypothetical protein
LASPTFSNGTSGVARLVLIFSTSSRGLGQHSFVVQGEQPCRRVEHVDAAQPRNAQVHHVRVFKQNERDKVRPGMVAQPRGVFLNGDFSEVAARLLCVASAPGLMADPDISFDDLDLVVHSVEGRLDFSLRIVLRLGDLVLYLIEKPHRHAESAEPIDPFNARERQHRACVRDNYGSIGRDCHGACGTSQ